MTETETELRAQVLAEAARQDWPEMTYRCAHGGAHPLRSTAVSWRAAVRLADAAHLVVLLAALAARQPRLQWAEKRPPSR